MVLDQLTGKAGGYSETQAGTDIKGTTTLQDAVLAFQGNQDPSAGTFRGNFHGFERPGDESATVANRLALATAVLNDFGGGNSGTTVGAPLSSPGCTSAGPGQNTQFVDGFVIYSQYDPQWANLPYGSSTIAVSGCGPSAMAMVITALTGRSITPDLTAAYAGSKNLYVPGVGSSWSIAPVLAAHWGLKSQAIGADVAKITATLQAGGLVVAPGQGPLPFTTGGHYIVIRGVTATGMWKIADSAHDNTSTQDWDPQQLVTSMESGGVYAITK
jgi:hypothetical protein